MELELHSPEDVNFSPQGMEEVMQNIQTIVSTEKYSVPLDRDLGIDMRLVDKPMNQVQAILSKEITTNIEKYEPRVRVTEVIYRDAEPAGKMKIAVRFKFRKGVSV